MSHLEKFQSSNFANSEDCFALRRVYICLGQVYVPERQSAKRPDFDHQELYLRFFFFLRYDGIVLQRGN